MTTPEETVLSMSELTIDETAQNESNSLSWKNVHEIKQPTAQVESFDDEIGASSFMSMADQDMDIPDTFTKRLAKAKGMNKVRQQALNRHENGICSWTDVAGKMCKGGEDIHVHDNYGTVIINLGSQLSDHSTTDFLTETNTEDITDLFAQSSTKSPQAISGDLRSFKNSTQDRRRLKISKNSKKRIRQTAVHFRTIKRKKRSANLKFVSGQIRRVKSYHKADLNPTVNIHVVNNTGNIIIGDDVNYDDGQAERSTAGGLWSNGENGRVVADNGGVVADSGRVVADSGVIMQSPQKGPVFFIDKKAMKWLENFYQITNEIHPLRDNARWQDFFKKVDTGLQLARQNGLDEVEIFLTIEKSMALCYQGENGKSKEMVKQAKDMILSRPGLNMREFLIALSHCQLAALYRRERKLFKAKNAVSIAERNVEVMPSNYARVCVIYEKASDWHAQHSNLSQSRLDRNNSADMAKKEFKNCISTCERILSEKDTIYLRKHHFCLVKLALLNLDCETTAARNQQVSEDCIREAGDCISRMRQRYKGQMGESTSMLLHAAETAHFHRRGDYTNAEISAQLALHQATSFGFQSEIPELQEGLKHMNLLKQQK